MGPRGRQGSCFILYILIHRTSVSAFPAAISLSSIIREIPQNYKDYFKLSVRKRAFMGTGRETEVQWG